MRAFQNELKKLTQSAESILSIESRDDSEVERKRIAGGGVFVRLRGEDAKSDIDPDEVDEDEQLGGPFLI